MTRVEFIPDPSPYRDYLSGVISAEEFLSATDPDDENWQGTTNWTYQDWYDGAVSWVTSNPAMDLYEFQIHQFADLAAWVFEGSSLTPTSFEKAWEHFTSGLSGGPHHVPLDGHDLNLWHDHVKLRAREDMTAHAASQGLCGPDIQRLLRAWEPYLEALMNVHEENIHEYVDAWIRGLHPDSPHHVPLDPENEKDRRRERIRVSKMDCYQGIRRWEELAKEERPNFPTKRRYPFVL